MSTTTQTFTLTVLEPVEPPNPGLEITTETPLPDATRDSPYVEVFEAEHDGEDDVECRWWADGVGLPPGLRLAPDGTLSGTPTSAGTWTFDVTATTDEPVKPPIVPPVKPPVREAFSVQPELPRDSLDTSMSGVTGQTLEVGQGDDLQAALDAAQPGDEILLAAEALFTGNYRLRAKADAGRILIRTDTSLPAPGVRMTPAAAQGLATIQSPNSVPAITTDARAGSYRFMGFEVGATPDNRRMYALVELNASVESMLDVPRDIVLDRMYIHGHELLQSRRGVLMNAQRSAVVDSYISEIHDNGADAQAIVGWNGSRIIKLANSFLEASGENVMFGGADPTGIEFSPSDIELLGNHLFKPHSWYENNKQWSVKNLFELKNARRVLAEGNFLEGNWSDSQKGFAVVMKSANQNGTAPYSETADVTFRLNRIDNVRAVFNLSAHGDNPDVVAMNKILLQDNLVTRVGPDGDYGTNIAGYQILNGIVDLEIGHNTVILPAQKSLAAHEGNSKVENLVVVNNIFGHAYYGWRGTGTNSGVSTLDRYADPWFFEGSAIYSSSPGSYPPGNFHPSDIDAVGFVDAFGGDYRLASDSALKGVGLGGVDPGANVAAVEALTAGVRSTE